MIESYNGCYIADEKVISDEKCNTKSAPAPLQFASEFARRNPAFVSRFLTGITKTDTCWLWTRGRTRDGYGQIATGSYKPPMSTHRVSWLVHRGSIQILARYVPRQNGKALAREFHTSLVTICRIAAGTQRRPRPAQKASA